MISDRQPQEGNGIQVSQVKLFVPAQEEKEPAALPPAIRTITSSDELIEPKKCIVLSDGRLAVILKEKKNLWIWDVESGKLAETYLTTFEPDLLEASHQGRVMVGNSYDLMQVDIPTKKTIAVKSYYRYSSAATSPAGNFVVGLENGIGFLAPFDFNYTKTFSSEHTRGFSKLISLSSRYIIGIKWNKESESVVVWDITEKNTVGKDCRVTLKCYDFNLLVAKLANDSFAMTKDDYGNQVVYLNKIEKDKNSFHVVLQGELSCNDGVKQMTALEDDRYLAIADKKGSVHLWNVAEKRCVRSDAVSPNDPIELMVSNPNDGKLIFITEKRKIGQIAYPFMAAFLSQKRVVEEALKQETLGQDVPVFDNKKEENTCCRIC